MRTGLTVAVLAPSLFCLLLIVAPSPTSAQCGPGGAGCGGGCSPYGAYCDGVGCAVPGVHTLSPGYCTPAQKAAGGYEVFGYGQCGNNGSGGCVCYLPQSNYQIIRDCYVRYPSSGSEAPSGEVLPEGQSGTCGLQSGSGWAVVPQGTGASRAAVGGEPPSAGEGHR